MTTLRIENGSEKLFLEYDQQIMDVALSEGYNSVLVPMTIKPFESDAELNGGGFCISDSSNLITDNLAVQIPETLVKALIIGSSETASYKASEQEFIKYWEYGIYMNFSAIVVPLPLICADKSSSQMAFLAGILARLLRNNGSSASATLKVVFCIDINLTKALVETVGCDDGRKGQVVKLCHLWLWNRWCSFLQMLGNPAELDAIIEVAVEFSPSKCDYDEEVVVVVGETESKKIDKNGFSLDEWATEGCRLWQSQNVRHVILHEDDFISNSSGYPVLGKIHQRFLRFWLMHPGMNVILSHRLLAKDGGINAYLGGGDEDDDANTFRFDAMTYIRHLREKAMEARLDRYKMCTGYEDLLQFPLQPLMDNLECGTYQVFESDPVKYDLYEEAMLKAMQDYINQPKSNDNDDEYIIVIAGAGRGPLVQRALNATAKLEESPLKIKIFAVEKNISAVIRLQHLKESVWSNEPITIVKSDMRNWKPSFKKANLLVSELLGSFGDNELSPECLVGAMHVLDPDNGICIPSSYTGYLMPITSQKLHDKISRLALPRHPFTNSLSGGGVSSHGLSASNYYQTPFVLLPQNYETFEGIQAQPIFTFDHSGGERDLELTLEKFTQVSFDIKADCERVGPVHGFLGYFESTLYGDVKLSTMPENHSPGMTSWFPIFFPLETPLQATSTTRNDLCITLSMWRKSDCHRVWYEWCAQSETRDSQETLETTKIHNSFGTKYSIGL